jgi:selenocysteine-specific elongation factor
MAFGLVVGTAGHIDHGKTTLVRALTGHDLDALPEEKDRGITIALGFAPWDLGDRRVGIVDVPGHERLVRTMIAGAAGIDAVLLCVSALDGAMPQTREHLAILQLLGVQTGALVITMADLVDDEEMLELAVEDVKDTVKGTFLDGAPVVVTSAVDGRGLDALADVVGSFQPRERPLDAPFRLPVDRAFQRTGFGTVVTGTTWGGRLADGDVVQLLPGDGTARVRGIEVHGVTVDEALPGRRTALNLAGIGVDAVPRGTVVAVGPVPTPQILDVRYRHLDGLAPLDDRAPVRVLLGTAERLGRIVFAGDGVEGGDTGFAQLRLEAPLPCLPGDRFVVRRPSPAETLGGGEVLDPWAPKLRVKAREVWRDQLRRLERGQRDVLLERAGEEGLSADAWAQRGGGDEPLWLGGRAFSKVVAARLKGFLLEAMAAFHLAHPLSLGATRGELRRGRLGHLPDKVFEDLVARLAHKGQLEIDGTLMRAVGFAVAPDEGQAALQEQVYASIAGARFEGLRPKDVHGAHPEPEVLALLRLLERDGRITDVDKVGWVASPLVRGMREGLAEHFAADETLTTSAFKERFGLTRRTAIPWLEWLDARKWTQRDGDVRRRGPKLG